MNVNTRRNAPTTRNALGSASQARRTHPLCTLASDTMALKADPMDDERFDGMYLQVAQTIGGIDPLLDSFFGFLRRKTDFFAGAADPAKARETVLAAFEKNKERSDEELKETIRCAKEGTVGSSEKISGSRREPRVGGGSSRAT